MNKHDRICPFGAVAETVGGTLGKGADLIEADVALLSLLQSIAHHPVLLLQTNLLQLHFFKTELSFSFWQSWALCVPWSYASL